MKGRKLFRNRRLGVGFEGLEERSLLATVSFSGGILRITGDSTAETVAVTEPTPGNFVVTGGVVDPFFASGVVGIVADMKAGDDTLDIGELGIPVNLRGSVNIKLGNDSDTTNLFINTPAAVTVDGGSQTGTVLQDETINVTESNIGALVVNAYAGNDTMVVDNSFFRSLVANLGAARLTTGQVDTDSFTMTGGGAIGATVNVGTAELSATNTVSISGADFTALVVNAAGNGLDEVTLENLEISGVLTVNTFGGDDTVALTEVDATRINIFLGAGEDSVTLELVNASSGIIDGGFQSGSALQDDTIEITGSDLGAFVVNTYAGADAVTLTDSFFTSLVANLGVGSLTSGQVDDDNFQMEGGGATTAVVNVGTAQANAMNLVGINGSDFTTLVINGGAGADNVLLNNLLVSNAVVINTFGGIDTIGLIGVTATNQVSIFAGAGNDTVELIGVITPRAVLDGGSGFDELADDGSPDIGTRKKTGFEIDDPVF